MHLAGFFSRGYIAKTKARRLTITHGATLAEAKHPCQHPPSLRRIAARLSATSDDGDVPGRQHLYTAPMPELPEVETTIRGLIPVLQDHVLASVACHVPALRYPLAEDFAARLAGRRIVAIRRRAKYMLLETDDEQVLIIHLGMSGSMRVTTPDIPREKHEHVVFTTEHGVSVRFNDPRRFGFMDLTTAAAVDEHKMLRILGPEPLGNHFNATALAAALAGRRSPIKAALLDQRNVAGLGNIYVCEALYWAGISPRRLSCNVAAPRIEALATAVRRVLSEAIEAGGSSLRDFRQTDGELGYFQKHFAVYGRERESCPRCRPVPGIDCAIRRIVQSGRSTFYCPRHQR